MGPTAGHSMPNNSHTAPLQACEHDLLSCLRQLVIGSHHHWFHAYVHVSVEGYDRLKCRKRCTTGTLQGGSAVCDKEPLCIKVLASLNVPSWWSGALTRTTRRHARKSDTRCLSLPVCCFTTKVWRLITRSPNFPHYWTSLTNCVRAPSDNSHKCNASDNSTIKPTVTGDKCNMYVYSFIVFPIFSLFLWNCQAFFLFSNEIFLHWSMKSHTLAVKNDDCTFLRSDSQDICKPFSATNEPVHFCVCIGTKLVRRLETKRGMWRPYPGASAIIHVISSLVHNQK